MVLRNELQGIACHWRNFTEEKPIALLAFSAELKDPLNNCSVCEEKAVRVLVYLLSGGAEELNEVYTANWMSIDAHISQGT